jgi:hypothetical protein
MSAQTVCMALFADLDKLQRLAALNGSGRASESTRYGARD